MKTLKEYAKENGITYEAVRKKVEKHSEDLEGHILKKGNTRVLDDVALDYLEKLKGEEVVVYTVPKEDEIKKLQEQTDALKAKIFELQEQLIASKENINSLQRDLLEERNKVVLLTQENTQLQLSVKPEEEKQRPWWQKLFGKKTTPQNATEGTKTRQDG